MWMLCPVFVCVRRCGAASACRFYADVSSPLIVVLICRQQFVADEDKLSLTFVFLPLSLRPSSTFPPPTSSTSVLSYLYFSLCQLCCSSFTSWPLLSLSFPHSLSCLFFPWLSSSSLSIFFFLSLPLVLFALSCARLPSCPPLSRPMFCLVIILFLVTPLVFWPLSSLAPCHMLLFVSLIFFLTFSSCRLPLHLYASNFSFFPTSRPWNTLLSSFIILSFFAFYPVKSSSVTRIVHLPAILSTSASSPALSLYICLFFLLRPDAEWNVLY